MPWEPSRPSTQPDLPCRATASTMCPWMPSSRPCARPAPTCAANTRKRRAAAWRLMLCSARDRKASCRERVWQYGVDLGGRRIIKKKDRENSRTSKDVHYKIAYSTNYDKQHKE